MMKKLLVLSLGISISLGAIAQDASKSLSAMKKNIADVSTTNLSTNYVPAKVQYLKGNNTSSVSVITIGQAANILSTLYPGIQYVSTDNNINTIVFAHRAVTPGSAYIKYDYSFDGGATWTIDQGPIYDPTANANNSVAARYPGGAIYNPAGNTNPANASYSLLGAALGVGGSFGGVSQAFGKINDPLTFNGGHYLTLGDPVVGVDVNQLPYGQTRGLPGEFWAVDQTNDSAQSILVYKGVVNGTGDDITWAHFATIPLPFDVSTDSTTNAASIDMAFSPDGMTGWIASTGDWVGNNAHGSYTPLFYKSTDGGATWSAPIVVDLTAMPNLMAALDPAGSGIPLMGFEIDLSVDALGHPHFFAVTGNSNGTYSISSGLHKDLFDVTTDGTTWSAVWVDSVSAFRGTVCTTDGPYTQDIRPQTIMSPDGSTIAYVWSDTDPALTGDGSNDFPNVFVTSRGVNSSTFSPKVNISEGTDVDATAFLHSIPQYGLNGSTGMWNIPVITAAPNAAGCLGATTYKYLSGVETPLVPLTGINHQLNNLFSVSNNYPNPVDQNTSFDIMLNKASNVSVRVSNILGQVVYTDNSNLAAGKHTVNLNAEGFASGVYFYTVNAGGFEVTNKMVVK